METTNKYILAIDQGTSSSRAILFDKDLHILGIEQTEFKQTYPHPGWVEHNPEDIWESQYTVCKNLLAKLNILPNEVTGIGITNQRETAIVWDRTTGKPIYNAIVWQDKRTSDFCKQLKSDGYIEKIKQKTGLVIDSYFSATKINWILNNVDGAKEKAQRGELLFGTVDSWLIWKLTKGRVHVTDYSNASRTMLYNINSLEWDDELLDVFDIPKEMLPQVKSSSEIFCKTDPALFDRAEIPITGVAGDQQAALFGQACFETGAAKNTYGTGCFMLMNTGEEPVFSGHGMLTTIAWGINGKLNYAMEGSVFIGGAAIKWLRDGLKLIKKASETQAIAENTETTEGIYVVPAFSGLGAPFWDMFARGAILGITQGVTDKHIVKATLESIAYRTRDVLDAMCQDAGVELSELNVDGGASANDYLMQFQADIIGCPVLRSSSADVSALGAAYLAGLAVDMWTSLAEIEQLVLPHDRFEPQLSDQREKKYKGWLKAVRRSGNWISDAD